MPGKAAADNHFAVNGSLSGRPPNARVASPNRDRPAKAR